MSKRPKNKAKSAPKGKHAGGRPTKYKPAYCQQLIDYFDIEPFKDIEIPHYKNGEISWIDKKRLPARLPTLRKFAKSIEISYVTVYAWIKQHKEFSNAFTHAQLIRKEFLIDNGLQGLYPPLTFKFVAVNLTDMRDKLEHGLDDAATKTIKSVMDIIDGRSKGLPDNSEIPD
jgi:hypothetical protein